MEQPVALRGAATTILLQLDAFVRQLADNEFVAPAENLLGATLGQHLRHTLEFFICLKKGVGTGVVNYDHRAHSRELETNRAKALSAIEEVQQFVNLPTAGRELWLEMSYTTNAEAPFRMATSFARELAYNIEHAVHHMALLKIGVKEVAPHLTVPHSFGVAVSTLRYQQSEPAIAGA